jgi:hypothetical protein
MVDRQAETICQTAKVRLRCTTATGFHSQGKQHIRALARIYTNTRYKQSAVPQLWCGSDTCGKTPGPKLQPEPACDMLRDSDTDVTAIGQGLAAELKPCA